MSVCRDKKCLLHAVDKGSLILRCQWNVNVLSHNMEQKSVRKII